METITTRELAELLAVSHATVKRWADAGTIRCFRTPGNHRKFRVTDVVEFIRTNHYPLTGSTVPTVDEISARLDSIHGSVTASGAAELPEPTEGAEPTVLSVEAGAFRDIALAGDSDRLVSLMARLRMRGMRLDQIFDEIAAVAMVDIGERWARGTLSVSQEHIASSTVIEALARLRPMIDRPLRERGRVVLACPGEEQHDLVIRMAALLSYSAGFTPVCVAARAPVSDLALLVAAERPVGLVLSSTCAHDSGLLLHDLERLAEVCQGTHTRLIAGGQSVARLEELPPGVELSTSLKDLLEKLMSIG